MTTTPGNFDDAQPIEGDDTGAVTEPEEYGSLTVEDDPRGHGRPRRAGRHR